MSLNRVPNVLDFSLSFFSSLKPNDVFRFSCSVAVRRRYNPSSTLPVLGLPRFVRGDASDSSDDFKIGALGESRSSWIGVPVPLPFDWRLKVSPIVTYSLLPLSPIPKLVLSPDPEVPDPAALYPNPKLVPPFLKILPPPPLKSSPAPVFLNPPKPSAEVIYGVADSSGSGAPYSTYNGSFPCLSKARVILAFLSHLVELFTRNPKFCILKNAQIRFN